MATTVFDRIIARELPAHIVAEDAAHIAFLDIHPLTEGHTLVVPKQAGDDLFAMPDAALGPLQCFAKRVAQGLRAVVPCKRVGMLVVGFDVPHVHLHLVPIQQTADLHLGNAPGVPAAPAALAHTAEKVRSALAALANAAQQA